jgi:exonuclease SbcC
VRILAIRGRNLASLQQEFAIELATGPLAGAGLFAITGPVGAGKSTLLDALCLPLFDKTPRLSGRGGAEVESSAEGDVLTANDARTVLRRDAADGFAEVDFRGRDGRRYRARWSVRRARQRADGRLQTQELSLHDLDAGVLIAGGRRTEVLAAIEARLGLDYAQFRRSVLLAQGDFAAFLQATPAERAQLLERLTGAEIYRRLSVAAFERGKAEAAELAKLQAQLAEHRLLGAAERAAAEGEATALRDQRRWCDVAVELAQQAANWHAAAERWRQQEAEALQALTAARAADEAAAGRRRRAARSRIAEPLVPRLEARAAAARRTEAAAADLAAAEERVAGLRQAARAAEAALRQRLRELRSGDDDAAVADWLAREPSGPPIVREFARHGTALDQLIRGVARAAELEARSRAAASALAAAQQRAAAARAATAAATDAEAQARADLAAAGDARAAPEFAGLPARQQAHARRLLQTAALESARAAVAATEERLAHARAELHRAGAERDALIAAVPGLAAALRTAEQDLAARQAAERRLQLQADLSAHRAALGPGEPCPLCGATDHPLAGLDVPPVLRAATAQVAAAAATFRAANAAAQANEAGQRAAVDAERRAAAIVERESAAHGEAVERWQAMAAAMPALGSGPPDAASAAFLAAEARALAAEERELAAASAASRAAEARLQDAWTRAGAAAAVVGAARDAEAAALADEQAARACQQGVAAEIAALAAVGAERRSALLPAFGNWSDGVDVILASPAAGLQCLQRAVAAHEAVTASAAALAKARDGAAAGAAALAAARAELEAGAAAFARALATAEVEEADVADAARLAPGELAQEEAALRALSDEVVRCRAVLHERGERRRQHAATDRPELDAEQSRDAVEQARAARTDVQGRLERVQGLLHVDDQSRRHRDELQPRLAAQTERHAVWAALAGLIGSASGDAFGVFAQSLTMDLLLQEANRRLRELARRYRLQRLPHADLQFAVVDLDLGSRVRSVQTLSGGESFLVSLALALALAALAAERTRIETLFLDEGFGTLDAENLETALAALDALQATGCQVGVISHVDGLAERIGAGIEVRPEGAGRSGVFVRG